MSDGADVSGSSFNAPTYACEASLVVDCSADCGRWRTRSTIAGGTQGMSGVLKLGLPLQTVAYFRPRICSLPFETVSALALIVLKAAVPSFDQNGASPGIRSAGAFFCDDGVSDGKGAESGPT